MTSFQLAAIVITLTAALAYVNVRLVRLPASVGLMVIAMVGSIAMLGLDAIGVVDLAPRVRQLVGDLDFGNTLLHGMLGLLLFAGALHVDVRELGAHRLAVGVLALGSTLIATVLVAIGTFALLAVMGLPVTPIEALMFGALIAPTDPIAVLGMLKSANAPVELEVRIAGESLFNDGIGVVVFTVVLLIAQGGTPTAGDVAIMFVRGAIGGGVFGLVCGLATVRILQTIDDEIVEVLITLALVLGGYAAAEWIDVSAPIAAVVAGLVIGSRGRRAMSDRTRVHVDLLWTLIDEILNAVLFLMIGLVIVLVPISAAVVGIAALAIPLVLGSRLVAVAIPLRLLRPLRASTPHSITILTWGGLRGGLSIAMAFALPHGGVRDVLIVMTYAVVAWTILVQGLTFRRLLERVLKDRGSLPRSDGD